MDVVGNHLSEQADLESHVHIGCLLAISRFTWYHNTFFDDSLGITTAPVRFPRKMHGVALDNASAETQRRPQPKGQSS